jgi:hypothetical protein
MLYIELMKLITEIMYWVVQEKKAFKNIGKNEWLNGFEWHSYKLYVT